MTNESVSPGTPAKFCETHEEFPWAACPICRDEFLAAVHDDEEQPDFEPVPDLDDEDEPDLLPLPPDDEDEE